VAVAVVVVVVVAAVAVVAVVVVLVVAVRSTLFRIQVKHLPGDDLELTTD
jgi:hypothetical protein